MPSSSSGTRASSTPPRDFWTNESSARVSSVTTQGATVVYPAGVVMRAALVLAAHTCFSDMPRSGLISDATYIGHTRAP
jgi:hypothetical protein